MDEQLSKVLDEQAKAILLSLRSLRLSLFNNSAYLHSIQRKYFSFIQELPRNKKAQLYLKTLLIFDGLEYLFFEKVGIKTVGQLWEAMEKLPQYSIDSHHSKNNIYLPEIDGISNESKRIIVARLESIGIKKWVQSKQSVPRIRKRKKFLYTERYLFKELERIKKLVNRVPTSTEWNNLSKHSSQMIFARYGTWVNFVKKAGYEVPKHLSIRNISELEFFNELERIMTLVGRVPYISEWKEHSKYSIATIHRKYKNWSKFIEQAGYTAPKKVFKVKIIPDVELFAELKRIEKLVGRTPLARDWKKHCKYSLQTTNLRFGKWINFLAAAGYTTSQYAESRKKFFQSRPVAQRPIKFTANDLIVLYTRMRNETGRQMTEVEFLKHSGCSEYYLHKVFKTYKTLVTESGFEYVSYLPKGRPLTISFEDVKADILSLYKQLNHLPNLMEYRNLGKYNCLTVLRVFKVKYWREIKGRCFN